MQTSFFDLDNRYQSLELPRFHGQFRGSLFGNDCALKVQDYPRGLPVDKPTYPWLVHEAVCPQVRSTRWVSRVLA